MNTLFLGMACLLAAAAGYWVLGRGTPRPTGTWAMGALLASFAFAFASYSPLFEHMVEAVVPHVARLLSNSASLAAATSVLALSFQVNLQELEARRRIRLRLALLGASVLGMSVLFTWEQLTHRSPQIYALYLLVFISYLSFAIIDFLRQALEQSKSTRRSSVRIGLRTAAAGCLFALVYAAYKLTILFSLGLGFHLLSAHSECSSFVATRCIFSVDSPALAVLLICLGLTLPAVVYPITQARRHRWEIRSLDALDPLWQDLSAAMPEIVLPAGALDEEPATDADFILQRRVIEISDGILALRPYRSQHVQDAAAQSAGRATGGNAAVVEAAIIEAALASLQEGQYPNEIAPPSTTDITVRKDLRADVHWLLQVASAYTLSSAARVAEGGKPEQTGV